MHVYSIATSNTGMQVHAVGKNSRMELKRRNSSTSNAGGRSSSKSRGRTTEKEKEASGSVTKDGDDVFLPPPRLPNRARSTSRASDSDRSEASSTSTATATRQAAQNTGEVGASTSNETETAMEPPSSIPAHHHHHHSSASSSSRPAHSRRSSSAGTSQSPSLNPVSSRPLRSPSPAPLPAVMLDLSTNPSTTSTPIAPSPASALETIKLYSDANSTPFFRRLSWSTDGSLLLTPAGMFEDPFSLPLSTTSSSSTVKKGKKKEENSLNVNTGTNPGSGESKPTVYIYTRSNVSKPPVANLMGHRTTSIAIRFCPVLFDLRRSASTVGGEGKEGASGEDGDEPMKIEMTDESKDVPLPGSTSSTSTSTSNLAPVKSVFDLPYRMVYAVATLDSVYLYDTQQEGPICMFGNLHYAPFTDLTWCVLESCSYPSTPKLM